MRESPPGGNVPARPPATGEQVVAAQVLTSSSSSSCSSCPPPAHFSHCPPAPKLFAQKLPNFLLHHLPTFPTKLLKSVAALLCSLLHLPIFQIDPSSDFETFFENQYFYFDSDGHCLLVTIGFPTKENKTEIDWKRLVGYKNLTPLHLHLDGKNTLFFHPPHLSSSSSSLSSPSSSSSSSCSSFSSSSSS